MDLAQILPSLFAAPRVVAVCRPGTLFQILAIRFAGSTLKPGTGGSMFMDSANLVFLLLSLFEKRRIPNGFISCFDFQTNVAIAEAVASFKQGSPALDRIISELILSESFVLVIV